MKDISLADEQSWDRADVEQLRAEIQALREMLNSYKPGDDVPEPRRTVTRCAMNIEINNRHMNMFVIMSRMERRRQEIVRRGKNRKDYLSSAPEEPVRELLGVSR